MVARCGALPAERGGRAPAFGAEAAWSRILARLLRSGNPEQHRDVLDRPLAASALAGALLQADPSAAHSCARTESRFRGSRIQMLHGMHPQRRVTHFSRVRCV